MKRLIITAIILAIAANSPSAENAAGYAGAFMKFGIAARPMGMGGAYTAIAEGPESIYYNPAGIGYAVKLKFVSSYSKQSLDRSFGYAGVTFPIRNEATMAASWLHAGISNIMGRGNSQQTLGEIADSHNAFTISFSKVIIPELSFGANLRYLAEKLDDLESFTVGFDVGVLGKPTNYLSAGMMIRNLGSMYRWESGKYWTQGGTYDEKIPIVVKLGLAGKFLGNRLMPAVDLETSEESETYFRLGAEYWLIRKTIVQVEDEYEEGTYINVEKDIRQAGFRMGLDRGKPTFGVSLIQNFDKVSLGFDYAFMWGRYGTSAGHLISMNLGF